VAVGLQFGGNLWFTHAEGISMLAMRDLGTSSAPVAVKLTGVQNPMEKTS